MNKRFACMAVTALALIGGSVVRAAAPSVADMNFVAKVSQGGMYEVEASKLAEKRAAAPDVKDLASTEVHDHAKVNRELKKLADDAKIPVATDLNDEFSQRLAKLTSTPDGDFDTAYLEDMKSIHDKDEKLFAQEAIEGTEPFKTFAHQTDQIVKRHIGALHGA